MMANRKSLRLPLGLGLLLLVVLQTGCAVLEAEDQNYRINNEQRDLFNTTPPGNDKLNAITPGTDDAMAVRDYSQPSAYAVASADDAAVTLPAAETAVAAPVAQTPSVTGIDRSDWPKLSIGAERGITEHYPTYFADLPRQPLRQPVDLHAPFDEQAVNALDGAEHAAWMSRGNGVEALVQPLKFVLDMAVMPVKALWLRPIWRNEQTPSE